MEHDDSWDEQNKVNLATDIRLSMNRKSVMERYAYLGKNFDSSATLKPGVSYGRSLPYKEKKQGIWRRIADFFALPVLEVMKDQREAERENYGRLMEEVRETSKLLLEIQQTQASMGEAFSKFLFNQSSQAVKPAKKRK